MMYEPPCERSMTVTISKNRTEEVLKGIETGHIEGITLQEYIQVAFLTLMSGDEQHIQEKIVDGGNVYAMHVCLESVAPNQPVVALRKTV